MKVREIASKYGWSNEELEAYIRNSGFRTGGIFDTTVEDKDVDQIVKMYTQKLADDAAKAKEMAREQAEKERRERDRQQAIASMLVTSGFNFDGYTIKKYSGYISGDDAIQINRDELFNKNGQLLTDSLVMIRVQAMKELKEAAYDLGCNAVIGVDFDYLTFEPETIGGAGTHYYEPYVVCVTANGNAVVIEKD